MSHAAQYNLLSCQSPQTDVQHLPAVCGLDGHTWIGAGYFFPHSDRTFTHFQLFSYIFNSIRDVLVSWHNIKLGAEKICDSATDWFFNTEREKNLTFFKHHIKVLTFKHGSLNCLQYLQGGQSLYTKIVCKNNGHQLEQRFACMSNEKPQMNCTAHLQHTTALHIFQIPLERKNNSKRPLERNRNSKKE